MEPPPQRRPVKIGVREGKGPPPGYRWNVFMLSQALDESESLLTLDQREHMRQQVLELARCEQPSHSEAVDVRAVEGFFEIREKGGPLGKKNVRLFFCLDPELNAIVLLGTIIKQNDGHTPQWAKIKTRYRMRYYQTHKNTLNL